MRILAVLLIGLLLAGGFEPVEAARRKHRKQRKKRVRRKMPSDRVTPSDAFEAAVAAEVERGRRILARLTPENLFESPYVVSAIFYHDGFLESFAGDKEDADPGRRIVSQLVQMLEPEHKALYVQMLDGLWTEYGFAERSGSLAAPLVESVTGRRRRGTHKYALDLFANEGAEVRSVSDGVVLLAENGWRAEDPMSTSSRRGGNAVVIYEPWTGRFYRYCHLAETATWAGDFVQAGAVIGTVGHSGLNASQPGHGRHLHLEVNEWRQGSVGSLSAKEIRRMVTAARSY